MAGVFASREASSRSRSHRDFQIVSERSRSDTCWVSSAALLSNRLSEAKMLVYWVTEVG